METFSQVESSLSHHTPKTSQFNSPKELHHLFDFFQYTSIFLLSLFNNRRGVGHNLGLTYSDVLIPEPENPQTGYTFFVKS